MRFIFLLTIFLTIPAFGQETESSADIDESVGQDIDQSDPFMDAYYQRGAYLVYDCRTRHWVCTQELEHKRCINQRKEALLDYKTILPCAHFDLFKKRKDCKSKQQQLTNAAKYEQFCLHPSKLKNRLAF